MLRLDLGLNEVAVDVWVVGLPCEPSLGCKGRIAGTPCEAQGGSEPSQASDSDSGKGRTEETNGERFKRRDGDRRIEKNMWKRERKRRIGGL